MALGGDSIDDCGILRAGGTEALLGHRAMAPSTLGTFLRSFAFGHVRQLDRLLAESIERAWSAGAGPGQERLVIDVARRGQTPEVISADQPALPKPPTWRGTSSCGGVGEVVRIQAKMPSAVGGTARGISGRPGVRAHGRESTSRSARSATMRGPTASR